MTGSEPWGKYEEEHGWTRWGDITLDDREIDDGGPILIPEDVVGWHSLETATRVLASLEAAVCALRERRKCYPESDSDD